MHRYADDRLLWLLVAGGLVGAYYAIPKVLQHASTLTEVRPVIEVEPPKKPRCDENALKLSTLRTLALGPSPELRASATKIISDRFLASDAVQLLINDLSSTDVEACDRAVNAIWLLYSSRATRDSTFNTVFLLHSSAVVDALVNMLPLHESPDESQCNLSSNAPLPSSPVRPSHRPRSEQKLLHMFHELYNDVFIGQEAKIAFIKSGIITRWLAKYPFPCSWYSGGNFGRQDVVALFVSAKHDWASDDEDMANVFRNLLSVPRAELEFETCGLDYANRPKDHPWRLRRAGSAYRRRSPISPGWTESIQFRRPDGEEESGDVSTDIESSASSSDSDVSMANGVDTAGRPRWLLRSDSITREQRAIGDMQDAFQTAERRRQRRRERLRRRHREAIVVAEPGEPLGPENILERRDTAESSIAPAVMPARTTSSEVRGLQASLNAVVNELVEEAQAESEARATDDYDQQQQEGETDEA